MADPEHVEILNRGACAWNQWREEEPDVVPDLSEAEFFEEDLSGANLAGARLAFATLHRAILIEANLINANLYGADLRRAALRGANLTGANLVEADVRLASLVGVDLTGANVAGADFSGANLTGATLTGANLTKASLTRANLTGATLLEADLTGAICIGTTFTGATLKSCYVYGISAWDVNLDNAKQADLRITPTAPNVHLFPRIQFLTSTDETITEANITVDNLDVAQFLYLMLYNPKVRAVLDTITSKVVLILGRFSAERKPVLDALREALRSHTNGYIPVLFDFDPQQDKPVFETVKTLANLARFVIADLTDPRMVRSELGFIVSNLPTVPVQPIIEGNGRLPPEYGTWELYKSFLPVYRYADLPQLLASLTEVVITPVEGHVRARRLVDADSAK
jgi:uncharacterized protein YjbI with pentapeptide repeats